MKRVHIHLRPTKVTDLTYNEWFEDISQDWQHRAHQLQVRRWRQLKHSLKDDGLTDR